MLNILCFVDHCRLVFFCHCIVCLSFMTSGYHCGIFKYFIDTSEFILSGLSESHSHTVIEGYCPFLTVGDRTSVNYQCQHIFCAKIIYYISID